MRYKMVLFDLDGTILNTIKDLWSSCNYALKQFGIENITLDQAKQYLGHGIKQLILKASNYDERHQEILECFKKHYFLHYNDFTSSYKGIEELLSYCLKQGYKLGVYTNKVEKIAVPLVLAHFKQFDFIYGETEQWPRKPDPTFILHLLENHHLDKKEVLYIGDSEVDYELAVNANIDCVCVSYGFREKKNLLKLTDRIVDSPLEILKYLE
ncbi:MAG: HAD family hydrolase [Anaeroplasmataceae bacterium]|nr:HAD family hydrolase [Anaeroplasmataceae bacterium]